MIRFLPAQSGLCIRTVIMRSLLTAQVGSFATRTSTGKVEYQDGLGTAYHYGEGYVALRDQ